MRKQDRGTFTGSPFGFDLIYIRHLEDIARGQQDVSRWVVVAAEQ